MTAATPTSMVRVVPGIISQTRLSANGVQVCGPVGHLPRELPGEFEGLASRGRHGDPPVDHHGLAPARAGYPRPLLSTPRNRM